MKAAEGALARSTHVAHEEAERDARVLPAIERLRQIAEHACVELFEQYGLPLVRVSGVIDCPDERVLSARIDFAGKGLQAGCFLVVSRDLLERASPGCELLDWVGELANQVAGRLKIGLLTFGVEVSLTTPLTSFGAPPLSPTRDALKVGLFSCDSPSVELWLQVETSTEFRFETFRPVAAACGELFLF